jgi:hypothetical protein
MFILWSNFKYKNQYVLCAKNTLDKIKQFFVEFCDENIADEGFAESNFIEKNISLLDVNEIDVKFYYCEVDDVDADKPLYILNFIKVGEDSPYEKFIYTKLSNDKNYLMKIAREHYVRESGTTDEKVITEKERLLLVRGSCYFPHCENNYECRIKLEKLTSVDISHIE